MKILDTGYITSDTCWETPLRKNIGIRTNKETTAFIVEDSDVVLMVNGKVDSLFTNKSEILFENNKIVKITKF